MYIIANSATHAFEQILDVLSGAQECAPRNFKIKEVLNCCIEIKNPLDRLIFTPERKMNLSYAVGELMWYLNGENDLETMEFYSNRMKNFSDDGKTLNSAYGFRIFGKHSKIGFNQWENAKRLLSEDKDSRQAIIHLHTPNDQQTKDEVCTLSLQFLVRDGKLNMITNMRSNDIILGFTYDVFAFTMLQEIMAYELGLEIGTYYHNAGSMHIYENNFIILDNFTYCKKTFPMSKMNKSLFDLKLLVGFEALIRKKQGKDFEKELEDYFAGNDEFCFDSPTERIFKAALILWAVKKKIEPYEQKAYYANKIINKARRIDESYNELLVNGCHIFMREGIKIVVEGIDAAGKSTLVNDISSMLMSEHVANIQEYKCPTCFFKYYNNYVAPFFYKVNTIFDRFFFSEVVYTQALNRERRLSDIQFSRLVDRAIEANTIFVFFVFDMLNIEEIRNRMSLADKVLYGKKAVVQNYLYGTIAHMLESKGAKIIIIDSPDYDRVEVVSKIYEMIQG